MAVSPKCICPELLLTMPLYIYSNPFFFFCFVLFLFNLFSRYRYADFENLIVYRVWWGYKESMIKGEGDAVAGSENFDSVHPKKLFVQGLPKLTTEAEAIIRRAELERAFVKYGGKLGKSRAFICQCPQEHVSPCLVQLPQLCYWYTSLSRCYCHGSFKLYICVCRA